MHTDLGYAAYWCRRRWWEFKDADRFLRQRFSDHEAAEIVSARESAQRLHAAVHELVSEIYGEADPPADAELLARLERRAPGSSTETYRLAVCHVLFEYWM